MLTNSWKSVSFSRPIPFPSLNRLAIPILAAALVSPLGAQQAGEKPAGILRAAAPAIYPAGAQPAAQQTPSPATPALISLAGGLLTVNAQNSDLSQILQEIARVTGMSVTGLNGGPRVFGVYGPADPRAVLTSLLAASGYNFLLVGGGAAPRELVLTPETKAPPTVAKTTPPDPPDEYEEQYAEQDASAPY